MPRRTLSLTALGFGILAAGPVLAADFGELMQKQLESGSSRLFGFTKPLTQSATMPSGYARAPGQPASDHVLVAQGLKVSYLTAPPPTRPTRWRFGPVTPSPLI